MLHNCGLPWVSQYIIFARVLYSERRGAVHNVVFTVSCDSSLPWNSWWRIRVRSLKLGHFRKPVSDDIKTINSEKEHDILS